MKSYLVISNMTKYEVEHFKIQDGGRPLLYKSFFGHNSAVDCQISVKFCVVK